MNLRAGLILGRVSNLPTVWTNCLAGSILSGSFILDARIVFLLVAMSCLYISGMYLNDAYDAEVDRMERKERPIPSGEATVAEVFFVGFLLMGVGVFTFLYGLFELSDFLTAAGHYPGVVSITVLSALIVFYDRHHKGITYSPMVMGLCRGFLFFSAGCLYSSSINYIQIAAFACVTFWTIGLTALARLEAINSIDSLSPFVCLSGPIIFLLFFSTEPFYAGIMLLAVLSVVGFCLWLLYCGEAGYVGKIISLLIAAFSLIDGLFLAVVGWCPLALAIAPVFIFTYLLQKKIPGT